MHFSPLPKERISSCWSKAQNFIHLLKKVSWWVWSSSTISCVVKPPQKVPELMEPVIWKLNNFWERNYMYSPLYEAFLEMSWIAQIFLREKKDDATIFFKQSHCQCHVLQICSKDGKRTFKILHSLGNGEQAGFRWQILAGPKSELKRCLAVRWIKIFIWRTENTILCLMKQKLDLIYYTSYIFSASLFFSSFEDKMLS